MSYMNAIGPDEIHRRKTLCDVEFETSNSLTRENKNLNKIKSRACFAYAASMERKGLANELKETWEES